MRDKSPSSSTGDSCSGRLPITPRDGSEIGSELGRGLRGKQQPPRAAESFKAEKDGFLSAPNSEMGLKAKKLAHRKSASYDDSTLKTAMKAGSGVTGVSDEERRRERRRSEAKNAIEVRSPILCPVMVNSLLACVAGKSHERGHPTGRQRRSCDGHESTDECNEPDDGNGTDGNGDGDASTEHADDDG